jgi:hypothetical protein
MMAARENSGHIIVTKSSNDAPQSEGIIRADEVSPAAAPVEDRKALHTTHSTKK